ncbi:AraC family transcriptional regulator [Alteromonadaceae bacterium 2753L.S.0a.02]|nr:AraC family transcriptional regulator [Alteromonadaceae bacterium 2753L.S.0a.02]
MQIKVVEREPVTLACLRHVGVYGEAIASFWKDIYIPWAIEHQLIHLPRYGIWYDDPDVTPQGECRYDACVEVPDDFIPPSGAFLRNLPGGEYATLSFKGNVEHMAQAWRVLLRTWLPTARQDIGLRPAFEYFAPTAAYNALTGAFECELFVPVLTHTNATLVEI